MWVNPVFDPSSMLSLPSVSALLLVADAPLRVAAWGNSKSNRNAKYAVYGNNLERDWLYSAKGINIVVHGCLWSYMTDKDNEDAGCQEESSEDGTTTWYMMSNCRRAQVVFSVYASDSSSSPSCHDRNFKESVSLAF